MCSSYVASLADRRLCVEMIHYTRLHLISLGRSVSEILRKILTLFLVGSEWANRLEEMLRIPKQKSHSYY